MAFFQRVQRETDGTFGAEVIDLAGNERRIFCLMHVRAKRAGKTLDQDVVNIWKLHPETGKVVERAVLHGGPGRRPTSSGRTDGSLPPLTTGKAGSMIKNVTSVTAETAAEVARSSSMAEHPMIRLLTAGHIRYGDLSLERLRLGIADDVGLVHPGHPPALRPHRGHRGRLRVAEAERRGHQRHVPGGDAPASWPTTSGPPVIPTYRGERKGMVLEMPGVQTFRRDMDTNKIVEARIWVYDDVFVNKFWSA